MATAATSQPYSTLPSSSMLSAPMACTSRSSAKFALAQVHDDVCLVQLSSTLTSESTSSALSAVEAKIYCHEFITIFRYSHPAIIHPADFRVVEWLSEQSVLYEEDKETVFLARDVMDRLRKLTDRRCSNPRTPKSPSHSRGSSRSARPLYGL